MKAYGDIPKVDRELALALKEAELEIDQLTSAPRESVAKAYVCLAHDWYHIEMEEEGNQLLLKADKVCPEYFTSTINDQSKEDPTFAFLIDSMTAMLLSRLRGE